MTLVAGCLCPCNPALSTTTGVEPPSGPSSRCMQKSRHHSSCMQRLAGVVSPGIVQSVEQESRHHTWPGLLFSAFDASPGHQTRERISFNLCVALGQESQSYSTCQGHGFHACAAVVASGGQQQNTHHAGCILWLARAVSRDYPAQEQVLVSPYGAEPYAYLKDISCMRAYVFQCARSSEPDNSVLSTFGRGACAVDRGPGICMSTGLGESIPQH